VFPEVAGIELVVGAYLPGQETRGQEAVAHEADAESRTSGRICSSGYLVLASTRLQGR